MSEPYYTDDQVTLHHGRDLDVLRTLPDGSVNCVVTSPPYFGLRDYGVDGQRGLEASPAEYMAGLVEVFAEVRRVLADDGTCWLNLGDSYASGEVGRHDYADNTKIKAAAQNGRAYTSPRTGLPAKNLLGIPWRVAFALQEDGWTLRNAIVWAKPNAMPESVTDRLSTRYELVFLLTKARRYWFDLDAVREVVKRVQNGLAATFARHTKEVLAPGQSATQHRTDRSDESAYNALGANPGDVWEIPTQGFPAAHFAVMPLALAERCIQAGCPLEVCAKCGEPRRRLVETGESSWERRKADGDPEGGYKLLGNSAGVQRSLSDPDDRAYGGFGLPAERKVVGWSNCGCGAGFRPGTVLDPYSGSGTTGLAALRHGRRYVGIDLNADYLDLSLRTRLRQGALIPDAEVSA